jgi:hypothetical protein
MPPRHDVDHRVRNLTAAAGPVMGGRRVRVTHQPPPGTRADFKGHLPGHVVYSEYNVPFDVTAPSNAIDAPRVASRTGGPGAAAAAVPPVRTRAAPIPATTAGTATTAGRAARRPQPRCAARPSRHPQR